MPPNQYVKLKQIEQGAAIEAMLATPLAEEIVRGATAPSGTPPANAKLYVNTTSSTVTHYANTAGTAWVVLATPVSILPATAAPIADNQVDTTIRIAGVGTSVKYAREDHKHSIRRQVAPAAPTFTAIGTGLVITSQTARTTVTDEESVTYFYAVNITQTASSSWNYWAIPNLAGFQAPIVSMGGTYRSAGAETGQPPAPYMGCEASAYNNANIFVGTGGTRPTAKTVLVNFSVKYIRT